MPDRVNARRHFDESARSLRHRWQRPAGIVDGIGRILREGMQDIGEQQFLVLLLVMQTDLKDR